MTLLEDEYYFKILNSKYTGKPYVYLYRKTTVTKRFRKPKDVYTLVYEFYIGHHMHTATPEGLAKKTLSLYKSEREEQRMADIAFADYRVLTKIEGA